MKVNLMTIYLIKCTTPPSDPTAENDLPWYEDQVFLSFSSARNYLSARYKQIPTKREISHKEETGKELPPSLGSKWASEKDGTLYKIITARVEVDAHPIRLTAEQQRQVVQ